MTLSSEQSSVSYVGNNSTSVSYPIPFKFFTAADLVVTATDAAGEDTVLTPVSGYTVTGGDAEIGDLGSLVTTTPIDSTHTVRIERTVSLTQETTFTGIGQFPSSAVDHSLDKLTMVAQQLQRRIDDFEATTDGNEKLVKLRRDTAIHWATTNPVLRQGEAGIELSDDASVPHKIKIGDGLTAWNDLRYTHEFIGLAEEDSVVLFSPDGSAEYLSSASLANFLGVTTDGALHSFAANPTSNGSFVPGTWAKNIGPIEASTNPIGQAVVATRANCGNQGQGLSNGTDTSETATIRHYITTDCSGIRLVYSNTGSNIVPATVPNPITVRAGVLEPDGTTISPVFFGGKRTVVIDAGGFVISDPLPNTYKKGDTIWSRTYVSVGSGEKWYRGFGNYGDLTGQGVASGVDYSTSGTISTSTSYMYVPFMIVGTPVAPTPCIALVGDSIMLSTIQVPSFYSFAMTALGPDWGRNYSHVQVALGSDTAQDFAGTIAAFQTKLPFTAGCTTAWVEYGVNDFFAKSRTTAQVQADSLKIWTRFATRGIAVWQTTITPETTSTDGWITTANQTTISTSANSYRVGYNNWLRAGAPIDPVSKAAVPVGTIGALTSGIVGHPLVGHFEIADIVESSRDSGIWKVNYTGDGIHPNRTATNAMSAGVNPAIAR